MIIFIPVNVPEFKNYSFEGKIECLITISVESMSISKL